MSKKLPAGAQANISRKDRRSALALEGLANLGTTVRFKSKNAIFEYLAKIIAQYEKDHGLETKRGSCTGSGLSQIDTVYDAVELFYETGELSDNPDIEKSRELLARSIQRQKDLEISNLKFEISELKRQMSKLLTENKQLIESQGSSTALPHNPEGNETDEEKIIETLCQVIYILEDWGKELLERQDDGSIHDLATDQTLLSSKLMKEYHRRIPKRKLRV
ncbi:MAG: hypothetical protein ACRBB6_11955 [Neptuniibacter sp.]